MLAFSEVFEFSQLRMFINVKVEGKDEVQATEALAPPPSQSMSRSPDPTTGLYQRSQGQGMPPHFPLHFRVLTSPPATQCSSELCSLKCEYATERKMCGLNKVKELKAHFCCISVTSNPFPYCFLLLTI